MIAAVEAARKDGNSLGGVVTCAVRGCPPGWGEPVFDRLEADLAKAMLSLPASKGFEVGSGFAGTELTGREHNDEFYMDGDRVRTKTQSQRRRPGRDHQWRDRVLPGRVQAHGHHHARAAHRERGPRGHDDHGPRTPRPVRAAAGGAHGGGDGGPRDGRPRPPPPRHQRKVRPGRPPPTSSGGHDMAVSRFEILLRRPSRAARPSRQRRARPRPERHRPERSGRTKS